MNNNRGSAFVTFCRLLLVNFGRLLTVAVILGSTVYALYYAQTSAYGSERFSVAAIELIGARHLDRQALTSLLRRDLPDNLLQVDLASVRRTVEAEPWVQSATVRRVIPDRLVIDIVERQPAAVAMIEGAFYVVDEKGLVLDRYATAYEDLERPIVKGLVNAAAENAPEENASRMRTYMQVIAELEKSPKGYLAYISEVLVANPRRVALIPTEEPVPVIVGDKDFLQRYETYLSCLDMYRQLKERYGPIEYIDVTLDDRVVFHRSGDEQAEALPAEEIPPAG